MAPRELADLTPLEGAHPDSLDAAETVALNSVTNGRIETPGDVDHFAFDAKRGQRVVVECHAERIDSRLRAVLEVFNPAGRRIAVNRGFFGIDPLISFDVPDDGVYRVRIFDLVYSGSGDHVYRLSIDTGPRVAFSVPAFVQRGTPARVTLYGWNLGNGAADDTVGQGRNQGSFNGKPKSTADGAGSDASGLSLNQPPDATRWRCQ